MPTIKEKQQEKKQQQQQQPGFQYVWVFNLPCMIKKTPWEEMNINSSKKYYTPTWQEYQQILSGGMHPNQGFVGFP